MVVGTDAAVHGATAGEYPLGRATLPVKDVGRLLLLCADRPGLVAAVSTVLADAGANSVSLHEDSIAQTGGNLHAAHREERIMRYRNQTIVL